MKLIVLLTFVAYASAAAVACADNLGRVACSTCTGNTHAYACTTTISACLKCDNTAAACSAECAGKNFVTHEKKCLTCGGIDGCPNDQVSCSIKAGAVDPNSKKCKQCLPTHQKEDGGSTKSDRCVSVAIDNCDAATQQACELTGTAGSKTCKANTKQCAKCNLTSMRDAGVKGTRDDKCVSFTGVTGCDGSTQQKCTLTGDAGSKTCTAGTVRCTKCTSGRIRFDGSQPTTAVDDQCVALTLTGCKFGSIQGKLQAKSATMDTAYPKCASGGASSDYVIGKNGKPFQVTITGCNDASCTEDSTTANTCAANSKICQTCGTGKFPVKFSGEDGKCADDLAGCALEKTTCTAITGSVCKTGTKRCTECQGDRQLISKGADGSSDDVCTQIGIAGCSKGSCTIKDDKTGCKDNTATCTECATKRHQIMKPKDKDHKCVEVFSSTSNCEEGTCTANDAGDDCKANSKVCKMCSSTYKKKVVDGADDVCETCVSTSAACASGCLNTVTIGDACKTASSLSGLDLSMCSKGTSSSYPFVTDRYGCRNTYSPTCGVGTCLGSVYHSDPTSEGSCPRCSIYNKDSTIKRDGKKLAVEKLTTCTKCGKDTCTAGTCTGDLELSSNKCSAAGGNASNSTNSTGVTLNSAFATAVALAMVVFA